MNPENIQIPQINVTDFDAEKGLKAVEQAREGFLSNQFFIIGFLVIIALILFLLFLLKYYLKKSTRFTSAFDKTVLLVTVPKETTEQDNQKKTLKDLLLPTEKFFDNIGGLRAERGWKTKLFGRTDHLAFEIVSDQEGTISFYVVVSKSLQQFLEQQLHAQYPSAQIDEVDDYNIFSPQCVIVTAHLKQKNRWIFPIKTYLRSEVDPLSAITNSLSKIEKGEAAAIQVVARSALSRWHKAGAKIATEMQQGKGLKEAMRGQGGKFFNDWLGAAFPKAKPKEQKEPAKPHQLSPMEQEIVKSLEEKASKAGLDVNIRIVVSAQSKERARAYLQNITNAFAQYTGYEYGNGFKPVFDSSSPKLIKNFIYRHFDDKDSFVLNSEEMTSIFHLPLLTTETPNIRWLGAKKSAAPVTLPSEGIILGKNIYRGEEKIVRIKKDDRRRHVYMIGKTGTGKSVLISNMAIQDIENGEGVCVIDPNGDLIETIVQNVPKERIEDVIFFNPADIDRPTGLNLLEFDPQYPEQKTFVINEMIKIMDKLYDLRQTGGPIFEQYMRNAMLLVMDHPESGSTLMEIPKVLADPEFRHFKLKYCKNPVVHDFWIKEAEKAGGEAALSNMTPYITSKLNQFIANDIMRPIIAQQHSAFNFRKAMDEGKIVLVYLPKGLLGDLNSYLLGLVIVGKITMAAFSRADLPAEKRRDFYLYIDEFQNFITDTISIILSEARKYCLDLTIAHQYIGQLVRSNDTSIRDAVLGTVGTFIVYNIGIEDAQLLVKQFAPVFNEHDLTNVERFCANVKLLVDNETVRPFNMLPLPPRKGNPEIVKMIKELSKLKYGRPKAIVEAEILERAKINKPIEPERTDAINLR